MTILEVISVFALAALASTIFAYIISHALYLAAQVITGEIFRALESRVRKSQRDWQLLAMNIKVATPTSTVHFNIAAATKLGSVGSSNLRIRGHSIVSVS